MRKIIILFQFFILCVNLFCQNYLPLPDSNATWIVLDDSSQGTFYFEYVLSPSLDDTLINSKAYHKIFLKDINPQYIEYAGAFRCDTNGKTFYVPIDQQIYTEEYLLYDLTKNAGDTIRDVALNYLHLFEGTFNLIVDSVKYMNTGPYNLKCLYLSLIPPYPPYYNYNQIVWVERIGSLNGGIFNVYTCGLNMTSLKCMSVDDTTYYSPTYPVSCFFGEEINLLYEQGVCDLLEGVDGSEYDNSRIFIFPNPANDYIFIKNLPSGQIDACIFNAFGQSVFNRRLNTFDNNFFTLQPNLKQGVYFIKLILKNNELWKQKIIIE